MSIDFRSLRLGDATFRSSARLTGSLLLAILLVTSSMIIQPLVAKQLGVGKTVVIVLDDSGSMKKMMGRDSRSRMDVAKQAMQRLIGTLTNDTQLGIVLLNGAKNKDGWLLPLAKLNKAQAIASVSQLKADGGTPLGAVMQLAMEELLELRDEQPYGDYRLVVVTDGEATDAPVLNANLPNLVSRGVVLDVIGVDMESDHSLVQRSHSYRRANDAASFEKALQEIFAESSFDANTGEQGFALIEALPDGLAEQALAALHQRGHRTLSENSATVIEDSSNASAATTGYNSNSGHGQPNFNPGRSAPEKRSFITGKLFFAVLVMFIIVLFKGLTKFSKRR